MADSSCSSSFIIITLIIITIRTIIFVTSVATITSRRCFGCFGSGGCGFPRAGCVWTTVRTGTTLAATLARAFAGTIFTRAFICDVIKLSVEASKLIVSVNEIKRGLKKPSLIAIERMCADTVYVVGVTALTYSRSIYRSIWPHNLRRCSPCRIGYLGIYPHNLHSCIPL